MTNNQPMEMYGRIFVVVTVLAIILVGIFGYLFVIDRKVSRIEKELEDKKSGQKK